MKNFIIATMCLGFCLTAQRTNKPVIHAKDWVAITGKPLGATAGARIFSNGGNAVDAACAMLAATCIMYDVLSWGGETQALVYNPLTKKVIGINAQIFTRSGGFMGLSFAKQMDVADNVREVIFPLIDSGKEVHLNLKGVQYMDSSGISVIVESNQRAKEKNTKVELKEVSQPVEKVLAMARKFL